MKQETMRARKNLQLAPFKKFFYRLAKEARGSCNQRANYIFDRVNMYIISKICS